MRKERICETCAFWDHFDDGFWTGECKFDPNDEQIIHSSDWCGQHITEEEFEASRAAFKPRKRRMTK